ncbi:hypothetical protein BLX24_22880 [Arsenicibacter rosenii]|uniref:Histidine kinase/HSP90-like ATPase domain-containing protein n=1 Tax=Arsenicibacter rosenii TaxID=1750698 RepID=A0A1S2VEH5_9BACT|nr:hypothetical protein BLX24_22880 [Arsenicibacter rosenii]
MLMPLFGQQVRGQLSSGPVAPPSVARSITARGYAARVFLDQLSVDDGLSQSEVRSMLKDSRGYMWLGTGNGLNRYDGYQITAFKNDPFNEYSLPNDEITALAEGPNHQIWVGTADGLGRLDPMTGRVTRLPELAGQKIAAITCDSNRSVWVATARELVQVVWLAPGPTQVRRFRVGSQWEDKNVLLRCLHYDARRQMLWIGTTAGLARLSLARVPAPAVHWIPLLNNEQNRQLPNPFVLSVVSDAAGRLWAATPQGLACLDGATGESIAVPELEKYLAGKLINAVLIDRTQTLWVAQGQEGVLRFDISQRGKAVFLEAIQQDMLSVKGLKSGHVVHLYEGPDPAEDIVWIGTYDAGVHLYSRTKNSFRLWNLISDPRQPSTAAAVFSICTDYNGDRWFGTYSGLLRIRTDGQQDRFLSNPNDPFSLSNDFIHCLLVDRNKTLWVGTAVGLQRFDRARNRFLPVFMPMVDKEMPLFQAVFSLLEDHKGRIWVGGSRSLRCIDPKTNRLLAAYSDQMDDGQAMQLRTVSAISEDKSGNLWVGTWAGLYHFNPVSGQFTQYTYAPRKPDGLLSNQVLGLLIDRRQQLWVCSSKGLSRLVSGKNGKTFKHYQRKDGLPNSMVYGIMEDKAGKLWMSTNYGLASFDPVNGQFQTYDAEDGLLTNEFNMGAFHKSPAGELFFGGIGNAVSFDPAHMVVNRQQSPVRLTSFRVFDRVLNVDSLMLDSDQVVLQPGDAFFTVGFTSLDFTQPQKNQFAYQLEGLQDEWVSSGNRRYVSFIDLAPGDYVLKIKGARPNGAWNEAGMLQLPIRILPPFWRTWWFYFLVFTAISFLFWTIYSLRLRQRIENALVIERIKLAENERVRRLAAQDLHDEFGNTITRISMLTELIRAQLNGQAKEIDPLLTKISDNSSRLYQGTKDFIWAINPEHDNLYEVFIRIKDFGDDIFDKTGIVFQAAEVSETLRQVPLPMGASRHLIFLFKEAMSNTLKHASATSVCLWVEAGKADVNMYWRDNGTGMTPTPGYMGNGLLNMQSRARRLGGQVSFHSQAGQGTTVSFTMSIPRNAG